MTYSDRSCSARAMHVRVHALIENDLGHTLAVAQVNEDHLAEVAAAVHPAHQKHALAGIGGAQFAAVCVRRRSPEKV